MNHLRLATVVLFAAACNPSPEPLPDAPSVAPPRGAGEGKGDVVGRCQGRCGEEAAGCWCDPSCVSWGDCCPDYRSACETRGEVRVADRLPSDARAVPVFVDLFEAELLSVPLRVDVEPPFRLAAVGHGTASPAAREGERWRGTKPLAWLDVDCPDEACDPATIQLVAATDGAFVAARSVSFGPAEGALSEVPCRDTPHTIHEDGPAGLSSRVEGVWRSTLDTSDGFHLRILRGGHPVDRFDLLLSEAPRLGEPINLAPGERVGLGEGCAPERVLVHELEVLEGEVARASISWWGRCAAPVPTAGVVPPPGEARGCIRHERDAAPWLVPFDDSAR